ncbi:MAG: Npt1/Npt2 family nucleotide transporter [Chlamydiales bacterium]
MKIIEKNQSIPDQSTKISLMKRALILGQFFLIIFVYHILKDLKDTLVITASDAGAEVIPFLKIWGMLPLAVFVSYLFSKIFQQFGREKTLYIFITSLLCFYAIFAFCLVPFSNELYLNHCENYLKITLPFGCKGFISMICHWIYSLFYLTAELWSMIILSVLFWGYVNEETSLKQAKQFYPICMFIGNCAGIISGQTSRLICQTLMNYVSWQQNLQVMISLVIVCGLGIMGISYRLSLYGSSQTWKAEERPSISFKESLLGIFQSPQLLCIAIMVVGFGLTSNLFEVIWKESVKNVYPLPHTYNAYMNQLTSLIGFLAVVMSLISRWIFKKISWSTIALLTPITLCGVCVIYFTTLHLSDKHLSALSTWFHMSPVYLIMTIGSFYYVLGLTAKYTIFDMSKEMAFLAISADVRTRAKSIIDSIGSRLGKSGASSIYQVLFITFGSTAGHVSFIGIFSILIIALSIGATKRLGHHLLKKGENYESIAKANQ